MHYNDLTRWHFESPGRAGVLAPAPDVHRGSGGSRARGTWVQFDVRIGRQDAVAIVREVRFLAFGCPHVIAVADWIAERSTGRVAAAALPEDIFALQQRFAAPIEKRGRLLLIEDAWIAAISSPLKG